MVFQTPLLVTFVGYTAIILIIAYISTRLTSNISDYVLGGRRLSGPITALGAGASDMSSWLLMALPGSVYEFGLSMIWLPIALIAGAYCNWRFIATRLRIYTEVANDSLTIPEYFCNRFKDKGLALRVAISLSIIVFFTFYSAAGFRAGAILLETIFGIDYVTALLISAAVIIAYTAIGGFLAVSWIDFFQGSLMFVALLMVPIVACINLGGWTETLHKINLNSSTHLDAFSGVTILGLLSLFAWGFGYFGQLHINTRFMAIRSVKELPLARLICINWMTLALLGAVATGLFGFAYYAKNPLADNLTVFINLSQQLFNPWIAGFLLSAVISATMSNVSAQILMSASILVEDFYHRMFRKKASNRENIWASRIILVLISSISVIIAANPSQSIFKAVAFAWSGLGAAFGPTLIFSLFWRRMTRLGAIAGIISGALTVILVRIWFQHPDLIGGFELLPGFIMSSLLITIVSLNTAPPSHAVTADFDKAMALVAAAP